MKAPASRKSQIRKFNHRVWRGIRGIIVIQDSPHRIAWGVAIGTLVAYLPIVGIQMLVGAFVCFLVRANVLASIPMAWITNPVTIVPIYYLLYLLGGVFTGDEMTYADMENIIEQINQAGIFTSEGLGITIDLVLGIFWPTFIGGFIVGTANGILFYFLTLKIVHLYQLKRHNRRLAWKEIIEQNTDSDVNQDEQEAASE